MVPHRVFLVVGRFVFFQYKLLVDIHAQAGLFGQIHTAVGELEVVLIGHIAQNTLAHVVMDADALFLDDRVVAGGVHIQAGGRNGKIDGIVIAVALAQGVDQAAAEAVAAADPVNNVDVVAAGKLALSAAASYSIPAQVFSLAEMLPRRVMATFLQPKRWLS